MKRPEISVSAGAYLGLAMGILTLPLDCLLAAATAAGIHECCHLFVLTLCNVPIAEVKIGFFGAKIRAGVMTCSQEIICVAAGPIGSLSLLLIARWMPLLALFGLCQGLFNLLPIYPLDGGRICRSIFLLAKTHHCEYNSPNYN